MKAEQVKQTMQHIIDQGLSPETTDLWPVIQSSLVAGEKPFIKQGAHTMKSQPTNRSGLRWAVGVCLSVALLLTFFLAVPQGQALAQEIIHFFIRSDTGQMALPVVDTSLSEQPEDISAGIESQPVAEGGCGSILSPSCSLEEAQTLAEFSAQLPAALPEETEFSGARPIDGGIVLGFDGPQGIVLLIESQITASPDQVWTIGRDASIESVMVGAVPGEYVQGGWIGLGLSGEDSITWDQDLPTRTLRWQNGENQFTLVNLPASSADGPLGLSLAEMTAIGVSLTPAADDTTYAGMTGITLAEAETQAGFTYIEPAWLPGNLYAVTPITTYDSQHHTICRYYQASPDDVVSTLVIAESDWALPAPADLQMQFIYDGQVIEMPLNDEQMTVSGASGGTGIFIETGLQVDAFCGGAETTANRALLWQQGNRTFILFAQLDANDGRGFVTRLEMVRLAESLDGVELADNVSIPDPERLLSLADAESLSGLDIQLPGLMLEGVRFDHIAVQSPADQPQYVTTFYAGQPVGDGRLYHVLITQTPNSQMTLDILRLAGGFSDTMVNGQPAIYQSQCWASTGQSNSIECHTYLSWFEGATQYDIFVYFPAEVTEEVMIAMAESMR